MAILIPSKNIYEYVESNKISKSAIKKIVIEAKKPQIVKEKEVVVLESDCQFVASNPIEEANVSSTVLIGDYHLDNDAGINYLLNVAIAKKEWKKNYIEPINFKKYQGKKLITNVYNKNDRNTDPKFDYDGLEVKGNLNAFIQARNEQGAISAGVLEGIINNMTQPTLLISYIEDDIKSNYALQYVEPILSNYNSQTEAESKQFNLEKVFGNVEAHSITPYSEYSVSAIATLSEDAKPISSIVYNPTTKQYTLSLNSLSYIRDTYVHSGIGYANQSDLANALHSGININDENSVSETNTYTDYVLYSITGAKATLYGDTNSLELEDENILVGETDSEAFVVSGSELTQDTNFFEYNGSKTENILSKRYNNTLKQYNNGKETYVILCDFNEYYDENGQLAISTKEIERYMGFNIDDIVIPFVQGADGKDRYLSMNKDGTPKRFNVREIDTIYDGAVWQKLYLQEV